MLSPRPALIHHFRLQTSEDALCEWLSLNTVKVLCCYAPNHLLDIADLGCSQRKRSLPPSLPPSACVIGEIWQEFDAPSPSIRAGQMPPEPPWARPPNRAAWVGFGHLGKTAHFTGTETLPPVIPHRRTKLAALARRKGLGAGRSYQTRTHAPAARLREKTSSANPLWLHKRQQYPRGMWGNACH